MIAVPSWLARPTIRVLFGGEADGLSRLRRGFE